MKIQELALKLGVSTVNLQKFIEDFDIDLDDVITPDLEIKPNFERFAEANQVFLQKFSADYKGEAEDVAKSINQYFGQRNPFRHKDFIGYSDLFFHIAGVLEPFISKDFVENWGIRKPAGIVLYGPPGSGKIFWARKISEIIGYRFLTVGKDLFSQPKALRDLGSLINNDEKTVLFIEDLDEVAAEKPDKNFDPEDADYKQAIFNFLPKAVEKNVLLIAAAGSVQNIDPELLAPGRFDVLIPIFPPNEKERAQMILHNLMDGLTENALLYKILVNNGADKIPFWTGIAGRMKIFSNTMIVDYTQILKKKIKNRYLQTPDERLAIDAAMLDSALREASAKLTDEFFNQNATFLRDARINNFDDFQSRVSSAQQELDSYRTVEQPSRAIGFTHNNGEQI